MASLSINMSFSKIHFIAEHNLVPPQKKNALLDDDPRGFASSNPGLELVNTFDVIVIEISN